MPGWVFEIYPNFSVAALRLWRTKKNDSAIALKPKYGNRLKTGILDLAHDGAVNQHIVALLTAKTHFTAGHIRDQVRARFGEFLDVKGEMKPLPNIRTFERYIERWKSEHEDLWMRMTNPDGYKNKYQAAFGSREAHVEGLNHVWEIDASPVDALCVDGRYSVYALVDIWSRRGLFLVSKTAKTAASLALIRRAIMEWGVPDVIKTDNGSDFISKDFQTALIGLGIEQKLCSPYSPEQKPFVERLIGTLQRDLMPVLPGFVGHSVADRKKIEATKAFNVRLGLDEKAALAVEMDAETLQSYVDRWAADKYANSIHGTLGVSPAQKVASYAGAIRRIENVRALDLLLAPIAGGDNGFRSVGKKGIRVDGGFFTSPELALYVGRRVLVRHDPHDLGLIYVFNERQEFLCEAMDIVRKGLDAQEVAAASRAVQKAKDKDLRAEISKNKRALNTNDMIKAHLESQIDSSPNVTVFPRPSEKHSTPALLAADIATRPYEPHSKPLSPEMKAKQDEQLIDFYKKQELEKAAQKETAVIFDIQNSRDDRKKLFFILEDRQEKGLPINEKHAEWLVHFKKTAECRTYQTMMRDFGKNWFNPEEIHYEP